MLCSVTLKQHIIRYVNRVEQQYTEIYTNNIYTQSPLQTKWEARRIKHHLYAKNVSDTTTRTLTRKYIYLV